MRYLIVSFIICFYTGIAEAKTARELVRERQDRLVKFYKDLHENPELSGQEKRTAAKLAAELREIGIEVTEGIGGYGLAGILRNGNGPVTWVRADMDALPVTEDTGLSFKSRNLGVMHACGHDFHMAALTGVAYVLVNSKNAWSGTVVFIGQPAEETISGAKAMIQDGLMKRFPKPDHVLALHASGRYKEGTLNMTPGFGLSNSDGLVVTLKGKGTHGSSPHLGIDPFIMTAEFIQRLQMIVGREKDPIKAGAISIGSIHGGTKSNIIPDEVKIELTVRSYDDPTRQLLLRRTEEVAKGIAKTSGAPEAPVIQREESVDAVFNDLALAQKVDEVFTRTFGPGVSVKSDPIMGGEDFGEYGKVAKAPSAFFWVGVTPENSPTIPNHSPKFNPYFEKNSPRAIEAMSAVVIELNKRK